MKAAGPTPPLPPPPPKKIPASHILEDGPLASNSFQFLRVCFVACSSTDSLTNIFRVFEIKVVSKTFMPFMAGFENFPSEGSFLAGGLNYDLRPRAFLFPFFPMYCHC